MGSPNFIALHIIDWSRGPKWVNEAKTNLIAKGKEWLAITAPVTATIFPQMPICIFLYNYAQDGKLH